MILSDQRLQELKSIIGMEANCLVGYIPTPEALKEYFNWISKNHKIPLEEIQEFVRVKYEESFTKILRNLSN